MFHRLILTPNLQSNNKIHEHNKELTHTEELTTLTNENEENYMPIKFWLNFNNSTTLGIFFHKLNIFLCSLYFFILGMVFMDLLRIFHLFRVDR